jgi:hypothetical protein
MSEPIIFNEIDFQFIDGECCAFLKYKGESFTGKLLIAGNNNGDQLTDYEDGHAHGHEVAYYPDGKICVDKTYDRGHCIARKDWYSDGMLKGVQDADTEQLWDRDGILAKHNTQWLYKNGLPIEEQTRQDTSYFSPAGRLAIKKVNTELSSGRCCQVSYYYNHVLSQCFEDLFTNYYPELDEHFSRHLLLPDWLNSVYQEDPSVGHQLLDCLTKHPTPQTQAIAARLKASALSLENNKTLMGDFYPTHPDHIIVSLNFDTRF